MQIDSYGFGQIEIDAKTYRADVIVLPGGVKENWWRKSGHELSVDDLSMVFEAGVEVLVVGTGANGVLHVLPEVVDECEEKGIELIVKLTHEAWKAYNDLETERKAAALHLFC